MRRVASFRLSAVALAAAGFLAGLGGGLVAAHAWVEADVPLSALDAPDDVRAEHGDRVTTHGRVVERRVDALTRPGETTFTYVLVLDDGDDRREFAVPRADHDDAREDRWIVLDLRWEDGGWAVAGTDTAVQPWTWRTSVVAAGVAALGAVALRLVERGVDVRRRGDVVEVRVQRP